MYGILIRLKSVHKYTFFIWQFSVLSLSFDLVRERSNVLLVFQGINGFVDYNNQHVLV